MSHPDGATDPDDASMMVLDQIRRPFRRSRRSPVKCPSAKFDINLSVAEVSIRNAFIRIRRIIFYKREIFA